MFPQNSTKLHLLVLVELILRADGTHQYKDTLVGVALPEVLYVLSQHILVQMLFPLKVCFGLELSQIVLADNLSPARVVREEDCEQVRFHEVQDLLNHLPVYLILKPRQLLIVLSLHDMVCRVLLSRDHWHEEGAYLLHGVIVLID